MTSGGYHEYSTVFGFIQSMLVVLTGGFMTAAGIFTAGQQSVRAIPCAAAAERLRRLRLQSMVMPR